jgi:hypothetical protein
MPGWQRTYATWCGFASAFLLGYLGCDYFKWTRPIYDPTGRGWYLDARPGRVPLGYYGQLGWALAVGLCGALVVWLAARLARRPLATATLGLCAGWTLGLTVIAAGYFSWHNWP